LLAVGVVVAGSVLEAPREPQIRAVSVTEGRDRTVVLDEVTVAAQPLPRLEAEPLTPEQRSRGFGECYLPDPLGLGPYAPYRKTHGAVLGRVAIPQEGGHTEDIGFDVVVHFHGGDPVRKNFVQVAWGTVFVAVDLGVGSGPYSRAFVSDGRWPRLKSEIAAALRAHTGDQRAHIRHLALSAWSAGYGAVNQILMTHGDEGIDAVVLLDGMHAGRNYRWPHRDGTLQSLSSGPIQGIFAFAARAARGEKIFVLTHSNVVPTGYASVRRSADLLLHQLDVERQAMRRKVGLLDQLTGADQAGFHVRGYAGRYEEAHCAHVTLLGPIVRDLLEPVWATPPMNRDVPSTPAPDLGGASG
jgi:hypothetical protein